ncbi:MAG: glycosyl hydrolase [Actinobacteria bacterium]|nr:glycosyl hydrolase [Actinomycetota bacterium]
MTADSSLLDKLDWRNIGPHRGGRVVAVAGDPTDAGTFWFGACAGGVWKTTDAGTYWRNVSDGYFNTAAVGAIAVAASNPQVVYAGMGESCIRCDVSHGDGVYRTTDGGRSWSHLGLEATRHIARVRVHPTDPDTAWVAALGNIFSNTPERGVYKTTDGGHSWELVLHKSPKAGCADLWLDPANPSVLFAAIWEAQRYPWALSSGGPDSGLWRSVDGGESWEELTDKPGFPQALLGRIGVCAAPSRPSRVWALVEAADDKGGVYRSEDGGESWERISEDKSIQGRPWYYSHIVPDPQDADTLYSMNFGFHRSTDGGKTWDQIATPHGDNHDLWIDPANPKRMIEGNDGGACVSFNGGETFSTIYNQPTGQFYHLATDHNRWPYRVYGTQQDNTAISVPSRSTNAGIPWTECYPVGLSESGHIAVDPSDDNIVISGAVGSAPGGGGPLRRYDHRTRGNQLITVWPEYNWGEAPSNWKHRFQWTYPVFFSPHDPKLLYVAGERVFKSTDSGLSWEPISDDLTRNDPDKQKASGGPINLDTSGAEVYCTIFALSESPIQKGLLWAGTDDGLVHVSQDGGNKWMEVTPADLPEWSLVEYIEPSPHDANVAYLCATRYRLGDPTPYLFRTDDAGESWQRITDGLPADDFTRVLKPDPVRPGLLYAGTETRLYVSVDDGRSWQRLSAELPAVPYYDLLLRDHELVVATHGRGFWICDDVTPLRELPSDLSSRPAVLFTPPPTVRVSTPRGYPTSPGTHYLMGAGFETKKVPGSPYGETEATMLDAGTNPRDGVSIWYWLRDEAPVDGISLSILDAAGSELWSFSPDPAAEKEMQSGRPTGTEPEETAPGPAVAGIEGAEGERPPSEVAVAGTEDEDDDDDDKPQKKRYWEVLPRKAGLNRFTWNLRWPSALSKPEEGKPRHRQPGWLVPPGSYTARLTVNDQVYESAFEVSRDPRALVSDKDLRAQHEFMLEVVGLVQKVEDAVGSIKRVKSQAEAWTKRDDAPAEVKQAAKDVLKVVKDPEAKLTQPKFSDATDRLKLPAGLDEKLAAIAPVIVGADAPVTRQAREVWDKLSGEADQALSELQAVLDGQVAALNDAIVQAGIGVIDTSPPGIRVVEAAATGM